MNWKLTIVFAAVLVAVLAVYFLYDTRPGVTADVKEAPVLPEKITNATITLIEIEPAEGEPVSLERVGSGRKSYWRLLRPIDRPADAEVVQQMIYALTRFVRQGDMRPEAGVSTGLDAPRLKVTFTAGAERAEIRFGGTSPTNTTEVFYQVDQDPMVHLVDVGVYEAFARAVPEIRSKTLIRFEPHRVVKIGLHNRYIVVRGGSLEGKVEYQKSLLEKIEKGGVPSWYLTEPWKEFVDPLKPGRLLDSLAALAAKEFQPIGKPQAEALGDPEAIVTLRLFGREEPIVVRFAGKGPSKGERWVRVEGLDEAAVVDAEAIRNLPLKRDHFRLDTIFRFAQDRLKTFALEVPGLGKTVIERREKQRGPDAPVVVTFSVLEPAGVRVNTEKVEPFVRAVLNQKIEEFLGAQDFKLMDLDPADATVTVTLKDGTPHQYHFGRTSTGGFMRLKDKPEAYQVSSILVDSLLRVELNFLHEEVFSVPRDSLSKFEFEWKGPEVRPVFYRMKQNSKTKFWEFVDAKHEDRKVDRDAVSGHLTYLNYIKARTYLTRDPKRIRELGLNDVQYAGRLRIWYDGGEGKPAEYYISKNMSEIVRTAKYYMLRAGDTAIFEVNPALVESLRSVPLKKD